MKSRTFLLVAAFLVGVPVHAEVIVWSLSPSLFPVTAGEVITADVVISGNEVGVPPSIGAFDFDVTFNPMLLSPTGVSFGPFLGDPGLGEALTSFQFFPGIVDLAVASLLPAAELDAVQPAGFSLATITFTGLADGVAALQFTQAIVDDAFGNKIPEIPEPATVLLLGGGLLLLGRIGCLRR